MMRQLLIAAIVEKDDLASFLAAIGLAEPLYHSDAHVGASSFQRDVGLLADGPHGGGSPAVGNLI